MPLYELYRLAREKLDRESNGTGAADQSSSPENDFFELVWENGQISTQGQSSRVRKSPSCRSLPSHCLPSHSPKGRDKDVGHATNSRVGKFGDLDTGLNEIAMSVPSAEVDLGQDEDVIPWLDYTMDGSLQHEYGSDFLHDLSGAPEHDLPASNNFSLMDKRSNGNQVLRESNKNSAEQGNFSRAASAGEANFSLMDKRSNGNQVLRESNKNSAEQGNFSRAASAGEAKTASPNASTGQSYPPSSHQSQTLFVSIRSRVSDITENNTGNAMQHAPITDIPSSSSDFSSLKMQKLDPSLPSNASTVMNFSHFARPAAIMRANLQNIGLKSGLSSARSEDMGNMNKGATATNSNPSESALANSSGECPKGPTGNFQKAVEQSKGDLKPLEPKSLEQTAVSSKQSDPACKEKAIKIDQTSNQIHGESGAKGQMAADKSLEPAVASSSVGSGNFAGRGSDEPSQNLKRKNRDTEDSECHSDDAEEESVGIKKGAAGRGATGSKRSRAAEVHNLSERRRRDRINEKMRALQELIPNCNKVDKASMLDEAIEYLKTLQLQVQIMSMGAGLYMSPMMLPPGMQHMHAPHMAPFSPMGMRMQMGLGMAYGMGMPDMNGVSSRFPMIQVPQMQGTHLPVAHMMGRSNPQGFALPGQGFPVLVPHATVFPFSGGPLMNSSAPGLHACGTSGLIQAVDPASTAGLQDTMPNVDPQVNQSTGDCDSTSQMPTQCEAATVGFEQSALVHNSGRHASEVNDRGTANPGEDDDHVIGYD